MRFIKLGFISLIIFFLLITAFSLLIPSDLRISRAINVMAEPESVSSYLSDLENWRQWHHAFYQQEVEIDQQGKRALVNETAFQMSHVSDTAITVIATTGNRKPVENGWNLISNMGTDSLTVQWYMDFSLPWYPWEKFSSLVFEKTYGANMEKGLTLLKEKLEE